jgi:cell division protein FtsB
MNQKIKSSILVVFATVFLVSAVTNILYQLNNLLEAKRLNAEYRLKVEKLASQNKILEQKIAESTKSAFIDEQARELLGLGSKNDVWLKLPDKIDTKNVYPEVDVVEIQPVWKQWWKLFTSR